AFTPCALMRDAGWMWALPPMPATTSPALTPPTPTSNAGAEAPSQRLVRLRMDDPMKLFSFGKPSTACAVDMECPGFQRSCPKIKPWQCCGRDWGRDSERESYFRRPPGELVAPR